MSSAYPIEGGKITGLKNFFRRRELEKIAKGYNFTLKQVEEALTPVAQKHPGKKLIVVFSQQDEKAPVLLVEEWESHLQRVTKQVVETGVFSPSALKTSEKT